MINIAIRNTSPTDILFYERCFSNSEFFHMVYGNCNVNLSKYVQNNNLDLKYITSLAYDCKKNYDLGFAHFYKMEELNTYMFVGGIIPEKFNLGYGIYAAVAILSKVFLEKQGCTITTGVFHYNTRSLKMLQRIGFIQERSNHKAVFQELTIDNFNNKFVKSIQKRINIIDYALKNNQTSQY